MKNQKGFSLIELLVVVIIIVIIAAIAIPNLLASRRAANESSAVGTLRTYHSAQATFQATTGGGRDYAADATALDEIVDATLSGGATVSKSGYTFAVVGVPGDADTASVYCADADPLDAAGIDATGNRYFGVESGNGGVVEYSTAATLNCQATGLLAVAGTPIE